MSLRRIRYRIRGIGQDLLAFATVAEKRRTLIRWLATVPAILVAGSIILLFTILAGSGTRMENWYAQNANRAMAAGDAATARICYGSLLQRHPDNPRYQFGLALALMQLGDSANAAILVQRLAPDAADGYAPAHLYLAEQLLGIPDADAQTIARAESHLLRYLTQDPKSPKAHAMLGAVYSKQDRWDLATRHLAEAGPAAGEMGIVAAKAMAQRGDFGEATNWTRRAVTYFSDRIKRNPLDDDSRLKLAQAQLMLREFAASLETLQVGWKETQNAAYPRAIAQVTAVWLANNPLMDAPRRLAMIEVGLKWDAQNELLLAAILARESTDAASMVVPTTQPVEGAAIRCLIDAVNHARSARADAARSSLEQAIAIGGEALVSITANLACIWAYGDHPDRSAAANLSGALAVLQPASSVVQRAHGLVLAKAKRWTDALPMLEQALAAMPADPALRAALAEAYDALDQPDRAATYRDEAINVSGH